MLAMSGQCFVDSDNEGHQKSDPMTSYHEVFSFEIHPVEIHVATNIALRTVAEPLAERTGSPAVHDST
jgi:hypothetical protein